MVLAAVRANKSRAISVILSLNHWIILRLMNLKSVIYLQMILKILYWGARLNFMFSLPQLHTKSLCVLALQNSQFEASTSFRLQTVYWSARPQSYIFESHSYFLIVFNCFIVCNELHGIVPMNSVAARGPQSTWGPDPVLNNHCYYHTRRIWWARHSPLGVHLAKLLSFPERIFPPLISVRTTFCFNRKLCQVPTFSLT